MIFIELSENTKICGTCDYNEGYACTNITVVKMYRIGIKDLGLENDNSSTMFVTQTTSPFLNNCHSTQKDSSIRFAHSE